MWRPSIPMMRPKGQDPAMWNRLFIVIFLQISSRLINRLFLAAICTRDPQEMHGCKLLRLVVLCYNVSHLVLDFAHQQCEYVWICMNPMMKLHVPQTKAWPATQSKIISPSAGCLWIYLCCLWNRQGWEKEPSGGCLEEILSHPLSEYEAGRHQSWSPRHIEFNPVNQGVAHFT